MSTNFLGGLVDTLLLPSPLTGTRRRRRYHSPEFKARLIAACQQPGVSMAAIALAHQINANLLRRWMRDFERNHTESAEPSVPTQAASALQPVAIPAFVPAQVPDQISPEPIRLELRRNGTVLNIAWPITQAESCALLLRELLR